MSKNLNKSTKLKPQAKLASFEEFVYRLLSRFELVNRMDGETDDSYLKRLFSLDKGFKEDITYIKETYFEQYLDHSIELLEEKWVLVSRMFSKLKLGLDEYRLKVIQYDVIEIAYKCGIKPNNQMRNKVNQAVTDYISYRYRDLDTIGVDRKLIVLAADSLLVTYTDTVVR